MGPSFASILRDALCLGERTMKIHRIALAFAAAFLLAGCLPVTSKTPIGTTAGLGADEALYGTWKGHSQDADNKTDGYFHFMKGKDGTITALVVLAAGSQDDGWTAFNVRTAKLGANRTMNAAETFDKDAPAEGSLKNTNIPLLYTINGKKLTLYLLDEDKVKEAIKAGKIAGTVESGNFGDVKITADGPALDAFMATPDAVKLFKVFIVLKRTLGIRQTCAMSGRSSDYSTNPRAMAQ